MPTNSARLERGAWLPGLLHRQAHMRPDAVAVVCGELQLTFRELDDASGRLGAFLRRVGVVADDCVGLYTEPSMDLMIGTWGILRAGAAYLPLYAVGDETDDYENFLRTGVPNLDPARSFWPQWMPLVKDAVARSVVMRRARIVSEPVTDYIRYEHAITPLNLQAGEDVRWLPRRRASDIPLPGNDFWLLDDRLVQFHHFTGTGDWAADGKERTTDPAAVALCHTAFETVWERGIPHEKYTV
ncbi:DUF6879 family protein [Streptomyces sp. NPDC002932]|uniref:DUF6879 family protein n=1 Tax=Streptomyces sp. NPDC002932 TaxID=3364672 RepID=UPI0036B9B74D